MNERCSSEGLISEEIGMLKGEINSRWARKDRTSMRGMRARLRRPRALLGGNRFRLNGVRPHYLCHFFYCLLGQGHPESGHLPPEILYRRFLLTQFSLQNSFRLKKVKKKKKFSQEALNYYCFLKIFLNFVC